MVERSGTRLVFPLIVMVSLLIMVMFLGMWRAAIVIRDQTNYEYQFFQEDLFQESAFTMKAITSLYQLRSYETDGVVDFEGERQRVDALIRAILGHRSIIEYINDRLLRRLPEEDPLLLRLQLSKLQPDLRSVNQSLGQFHEELQRADTPPELASLLRKNRDTFDWSIERLNTYLNTQTKIQSVIFSKLQGSLLSTMQQLSLFFYIISGLFILNLLLFVLYIRDRKKAQEELALSHATLESRVEERTAELAESARKLQDEMEERRQMEYQLRQISDALENSLNGFDIVNEDKVFIYANRAYLEMWGYDSLDEIIGTSPESHCLDPNTPAYMIEQLREKGEHVFEMTAKRKDGSHFEVLMYARLAYDENGKEIYPTSSVDVSKSKQDERERRSLEEQLQYARKMEAIGTLSGGISHEFNNILAILIGNIELAMVDIKDQESLKEYLGEMKSASLRGKKVVQQLLNFSRTSSGTTRSVNLEKIVRDSVGIMKASLPAGISIKESVEKNCYDVHGNGGQLQQVIINLCTNSSQAMAGKGGTIEVHLHNVSLESDLKLRDRILGPGDYVELTISDTGPGIPQEHLRRIFEPFFTTKDINEGSGMGLAVVHGIVLSHNGGIQVESSMGEGVEVKIYLPARAVPAEENSLRTEGSGEMQSGSILFVDDEEYIAKLGGRILHNLGYRATTFTNPHRALDEYARSPEDYDMVICDYGMPEMAGDQLIAELRKINPKVKVLLSSGYGTGIEEEKRKEIGADGFIAKPFTSDDLAETLLGMRSSSQS